ncbi:PAS domain-containing sensor histidine kinase [Halolamina sp. CBA1230]|uniref:PAS domain-containing sensor histidine kinase n=1 Tax=Halolamina sp. CBA1230 TaxID=1853690 RepID=UPI0009A21128|nr:PAS domain-containing sensor histidine kinase [Halolamina sp. CBA1230]QKY20912.1 PAS domain-containing sensor histidine kinase [Halolamina sp. CBA1230]
MARSESLGLLLDQAQDKIALLSEDGTFTYVNAAAERILGFEPDELVGENAFEFVHPDDVDDVRGTFDRAVRKNSFAEETAAYRHRCSDGDWVWLESRMSNLTDDPLDGYVVSSRDVTDRVRAEREREETAARLEEIAAVASDVLWMFDADWSELLFVNPAYEEIFGGSIEDVRGDPDAFLDAIHPEDRPAVVDAMGCLSAGNSVEMEYRVNPEAEYKRWVWVQAEPITRDGEVVRIAGFARDITDRRRRERQLVVMDNLLRHNLRNDLNVVLGKADIIEETLPEASEHTAIIRRVGKQLLQTAEKERNVIDLLTEQPGRERIEFHGTVAESVESVREHHPDCTIEVDGLEPAVVRGRPELGLAVIELLENAVQHADGEPWVRVSLRRVGAHAELTVADDHAPIPAIEADVLTGDHDMTNVYHSSGLGFWLVYWAVELSNGHVAVHSGDDGNHITVSVPLDREP